jgi:hypothetical protein
MIYLMWGMPKNVENPETYVGKAEVRALLKDGFTSCIVEPKHAEVAGSLLDLPVPTIEIDEADF